MLLKEKGHSFRIDTILAENNTGATSARHSLPVAVIPSTSHSRAVPAKRSRKPKSPTPQPSSENSVFTPPPPVLPYDEDYQPVYLDLDDVKTSRKRHHSEDDDKASVTSLESGRSTPETDLSSTSSTSSGKSKKARTSFAAEQIAELERYFQQNKYVSATDRETLSERLQLSELQVKTWFQNRRMKERRSRTNSERTAAFPTGGVDVTQLQAMGLPCPPPPTVVKQSRRRHKGDNHEQPVDLTSQNQQFSQQMSSNMVFANSGIPDHHSQFFPFSYPGAMSFMPYPPMQYQIGLQHNIMQGPNMYYPFVSHEQPQV